MLGKRNRGAGCGQVKSNVGPPYAGQCVCFDDSTTKAIFGQTPEVVTFANNNSYKYPQSVSTVYSTNARSDVNLPSFPSQTSNNGKCSIILLRL